MTAQKWCCPCAVYQPCTIRRGDTLALNDVSFTVPAV